MELPTNMTPEMVKTILKENNVSFVHSHDCSICGYPCGYKINSLDDNRVWYDSGCDCVTYSGGHPSSIEDIARDYNIQNNDKARTIVLNSYRGKRA